MSRDVFRPRREPAATLYDQISKAAVRLEIANRDMAADFNKNLATYHAEVARSAEMATGSPMTAERAARIETTALGHTDYVAQYVYAILRETA